MERYEIPGRHVFFGYYDVSPFRWDASLLLAAHIPGDAEPGVSEMEIGYFDRQRPEHFVSAGATQSWCWQQGCRLQWFPLNECGRNNLIFYNAFQKGAYWGRILDIRSGEVRKVLREPVYAMAPDGRTGYTLDFSRLQRLRPGYGYANLKDASRDDPAPEDRGVEAIDTATNEIRTLFSVRDLAERDPEPTMDGADHYINHLCVNPSGTRLVFFHLWIKDGRQYSRMAVCDPDGGRLHIFKGPTYVSHYWWRRDNELVCYSHTPEFKDAYILYPDFQGPERDIAPGVFSGDGHCSYSPDGRWMLTDTYPDKDGYQDLMLYDGTERITVMRQYCPVTGPIDARCDMHPRWSPDGSLVAVDSMAGGLRKMLVLDVSRIVRPT
jgi:hypothetical protein